MRRRFVTSMFPLLLLGVAPAPGATSANIAGNWKFILPLESPPRAMWLLQFATTDGKLTGSVIGRSDEEPRVPAAKLAGLRMESDTLRFVLRTGGQLFRFEGRPVAGEAAKIQGTVTMGGDVIPAELQRTEATKIDRFAIARDVLAKQKDGAEVVKAALTLLGSAADQKAKPEDARAWAERAVKAASAFGPRWQREIVLTIVDLLAEQEGFAPIALTYARQAERMLEETDSVTMKTRTLSALAGALEANGKAEEASVPRERIARLDVTIKPTSRETTIHGGRVALVELFTGAQCPPCVAADLAFDALTAGFKPSEVVCLEYHLHIPGADPMTSPDSEGRRVYYGKAIEGTPTIFFGGRRAALGGGPRSAGPQRYEDYADLVDGLLEQPAAATIDLQAKRTGEKIDIKVALSDVTEPGEQTRLRIALVEDEVHYLGRNKVAEHHHVVRSFPGGVNGISVTEKKMSKTVSVDLMALRKELNGYLDKWSADNPDQPLPAKDRPLELKKLHIVVFVQSDESGEVLQAAQIALE